MMKETFFFVKMSEKFSNIRHFLFLCIAFILVLYAVYQYGVTRCVDQTEQSIYTENEYENPPTIYAITPTYARPEQKAELTRLSHVFMLVPNLYWIIVEDSDEKTHLVENLLARAGLTLRSIQLQVKTPAAYVPPRAEPYRVQPRGVKQRNTGLSWLRSYTDPEEHGIVYFMDDENTYSVDLFSEMSKTQPGRVSVWPVGLVGTLMVERPILNDQKTEIIGFNTVSRPERPFPIDMAAFAISKNLLFQHPEVRFSYNAHLGYQETEFLMNLTTLRELQPLSTESEDVLVWHTRTQKTKLTGEDGLRKNSRRSDEGLEV
ncbi:galactosylgalactosylxylosylprotein 3-beta-glucuronosyltransferase I-like [Glossina fuscipes fuscipes]